MADTAGRLRVAVFACLSTLFLLSAFAAAAQMPLTPVTAQSPAGRALIEQLRGGGLVLFFRHADTMGMPCDRSFRIGDRAGQRNISKRGRAESRRIGHAVRDLKISYRLPVLAGPVFRARDTAELVFGPDEVKVTDSLLADDFSGPRLDWVLGEHRRLFREQPPAGANRILVGHRTPAIMVLGASIGGRVFPEGAALVLEPYGDTARVLGILVLAPITGGGFHSC